MLNRIHLLLARLRGNHDVTKALSGMAKAAARLEQVVAHNKMIESAAAAAELAARNARDLARKEHEKATVLAARFRDFVKVD